MFFNFFLNFLELMGKVAGVAKDWWVIQALQADRKNSVVVYLAISNGEGVHTSYIVDYKQYYYVNLAEVLSLFPNRVPNRE